MEGLDDETEKLRLEGQAKDATEPAGSFRANGRASQTKAASSLGRSRLAAQNGTIRKLDRIGQKLPDDAAMRGKWMIANYLVAVALATAGWFYLILWIAWRLT
jgi:hypothetical protein